MHSPAIHGIKVINAAHGLQERQKCCRGEPRADSCRHRVKWAQADAAELQAVATVLGEQVPLVAELRLGKLSRDKRRVQHFDGILFQAH